MSTEDREEIVVSWKGEDDTRNPVNWSPSKKWCVMLTASLAMFVVELNATSITSAAADINTEFSVSDASFPNSYWPVTSWTLAGAIFPILLTPIIEDYGTYSGFLLTYIVFALFVIPQAVAQNFATLIVTRIMCGACGGTIAAVVDGIAADLFVGEGERGRAVTVYTFFLLAGYTLGPVVGGGIIGSLQWRWIFYVQLILCFSLLPVLILILRETRGPIVLKSIAHKLQKEKPGCTIVLSDDAGDDSSSTIQKLKEGLIRPSQLLCTEPVLASFTLWSAFTLGMIFTSTQSIPQVYSGIYDWSPYATGVVQVAVFIGQLLGLGACWIANDVYMRSKRNDNHNSGAVAGAGTRLEARLYLSIPATVIAFAGGLFWYAWSSSSSLHWIMPTIGLGLVGFGSMCIVTAVDIYITDSYTVFAGSAVAAVTFGENTLSAFLPLATMRMYDSLGYHWASSLLGFISLALVLAPIILVWKGEGIRAKSNFMSSAGSENGEDDATTAGSTESTNPGVDDERGWPKIRLYPAGSNRSSSQRTLTAIEEV